MSTSRLTPAMSPVRQVLLQPSRDFADFETYLHHHHLCTLAAACALYTKHSNSSSRPPSIVYFHKALGLTNANGQWVPSAP